LLPTLYVLLKSRIDRFVLGSVLTRLLRFFNQSIINL
jgi:hypothetical protein